MHYTSCVTRNAPIDSIILRWRIALFAAKGLAVVALVLCNVLYAKDKALIREGSAGTMLLASGLS